MWRLCRIYLVVLFLGSAPCISQGLFESSQPGTHETLVSSKLSLGGFIRSLSYINGSSETPYNLQSIYAQAGLLLDARAGENATAFADLRFRYGNEFGSTVSELELREAYVDMWVGAFSFRAGKMITPWGKGSVFNPTAKLTPTDPTVRSPDPDDRYLGSWALQASLRLGNHFKFTGTWKPMYEASILLIDPVPMPGYVNFIEPGYPSHELKEGSYGLKADIFTSALDASLYWFQGYHHWPGIAYDSFVADMTTLEPVELNLYEKAYGLRMAGLDFSIPVASWVFRAEGAWQESTGNPAEHEYLPLQELSYTAEIERSGSVLTLLAGYYGKYVLDYSPPDGAASLSADLGPLQDLIDMGIIPTASQMDEAVKARIGAFNRLYGYQMEEFSHTVFAVGKINLAHEQVEITLPLVYNNTSKEWLLRPGICYSPSSADGFKIGVGFEGMYGPENSLYDMVGPALNAAWLSVRLSF